ncbi:MAG: RagB/SusD family nutrient uptake outer membrane protein [Bacteroidales bacterium]
MRKKILTMLAVMILSVSCSKDFLDTQSTSSVDQSQIFKNESTALMAINGIHRKMYLPGYAAQMGYGCFMFWNDILGEDMVYTKGNAQWQLQDRWELHRRTTSGNVKYIYQFFYQIISNANMVLENTEGMDGIQYKLDNIRGQALAYRGFAHFCAVRLYGDRYVSGKNNDQMGVIIRTDTNGEAKARASVEEVYTQINKDLDDAISLLDNPKITQNTISDIDVNVARGIKARVLLAQGRWEEAAAMAKLVIDNSGAELDNTQYDRKQGRCCDASNKEWLWGKVGQPDLETNSLHNFYSYFSNTNVSYNRNTPRAIYNLLYEKISNTDVRKQLWLEDAPSMDPNNVVIPIGGNIFKWMSQKYIVDYPDCHSSQYSACTYTADLVYMRVSEMYLIEAECYARFSNEESAKDALYILAKYRDPNYVRSTKSGQDLIDEIMVQRRVELWGEGFRWTDLKRLNMDLDRGPKPRAGYNQGGSLNGWKSKQTPTNLDPQASNYNMYDDQKLGEENRFRSKNSMEWEFVIPISEINYNPLCKQNPL